METTLHGCVGCNNDRVLVDKISYRFGDPAPGDVVVFRGPDSWSSEVIVAAAEQRAGPRPAAARVRWSGWRPPDEKDFVKRVIAVGGQTVQCCDSQQPGAGRRPAAQRALHLLPARGRPGPAERVRPGRGARRAAVDDGRQPQQLGRLAGGRPRPGAGRQRDRQGAADRAAVHPVRPDRARWTRSPRRSGMPAPVRAGPDPIGGAPLALGLLGALPLAAGRALGVPPPGGRPRCVPARARRATLRVRR